MSNIKVEFSINMEYLRWFMEFSYITLKKEEGQIYQKLIHELDEDERKAVENYYYTNKEVYNKDFQKKQFDNITKELAILVPEDKNFIILQDEEGN